MDGLDTNGNNANGLNFKDSITLWRGKVTALLEVIEKEMSKLATKETVNSLKKEIESLKDKVELLTIEFHDLDKALLKNSTKSSLKWTILTFIGVLIINAIVTYVISIKVKGN